MISAYDDYIAMNRALTVDDMHRMQKKISQKNMYSVIGDRRKRKCQRKHLRGRKKSCLLCLWARKFLCERKRNQRPVLA